MADTRWLKDAEAALSAAGGVFDGFTSKGHRRWSIGGQPIVIPNPEAHAKVSRHSRRNMEALIARFIKRYGTTSPPNGRTPGLSDAVGLDNPSTLLPPPPAPDLPPELEPPGLVLPALQTPPEAHPRRYLCLRAGCPKPGPYPTPGHLAVHVRFVHPKPKAPQRAKDAPGSTPASPDGWVLVEALTLRLDALTARVARLEDWTRGVPRA